MRLGLAAIVFLVSSAVCLADSTTLLEHKAWSVDHYYDPDNAGQLCIARSFTGITALSLFGSDSGRLGLSLASPEWRMPDGQSRDLIMDADYERWNASAVVHGPDMLVAEFDDPERAVSFLTDIGKSTALSVYNTDMRRIATFSLAGSHAAILKLLECWQRIYVPVERSDPFLGVGASAADPFL